jgi:hypothetical protein
MVGLAYFFCEIELHVDHACGELCIQSTLLTEPRQLRRTRASDDDHPVQVRFGGRFE